MTDLVLELEAIDRLPVSELPAALAQTAAVQARIAARLAQAGAPAAADADGFLSLKEVTNRIPYSAKTIRKLMGNGELKEGVHYFRPRGLRRARPVFAWTAIERWVRERATTTPAAVLQLHTGGRRGRTIG